MYDKVFPILFGNECMSTVRAAKFPFGVVFFFWRKRVLANFAKNLTFGTVILIKIRFWSMTAWALTVIRNVAFGTSSNWFDGFVRILITPSEVLHEILIIPWFNRAENEWKLIKLKFLIFRGMGIIKSPLFEWDIFTDKVNKKTILLIKVLN